MLLDIATEIDYNGICDKLQATHIVIVHKKGEMHWREYVQTYKMRKCMIFYLYFYRIRGLK